MKIQHEESVPHHRKAMGFGLVQLYFLPEGGQLPTVLEYNTAVADACKVVVCVSHYPHTNEV